MSMENVSRRVKETCKLLKAAKDGLIEGGVMDKKSSEELRQKCVDCQAELDSEYERLCKEIEKELEK